MINSNTANKLKKGSLYKRAGDKMQCDKEAVQEWM